MNSMNNKYYADAYGPDTKALAACIKKAFEIASAGTNGIHISYDLDVIDPDVAPGVSIPAVNGISLDEAYAFLDYIIKNKDIIKSLDLVINTISHLIFLLIISISSFTIFVF